MFSRISSSAAVLLLGSLLAGAALAEPVTVRSCNRDVTFDKAPERAISNDVNLTEMMLALKLQDRMVGYTGVSGWKTLDEKLREGVKELPELSPKYPSKEVLLGANADFFFAGWNYGMKVGGEVTPETLAPLGIKVYELTESCIFVMQKNKPTMDDMFVDLLNLGKIFRVEDRAEALVSGYRKQLAEIQAKIGHVDKPTRVFVYDSGEEKPFTSGRYGIPTAMIEAAGGVNVMDDVEKSWTEVSWEPVIEKNPEVIVIVDYGQVTAAQKIAFLKGNPAFKNIDAVKNDRFVVLPYVEATPGPRNIEAIATLAKAFHPSAL
ncbi:MULTISPECIES: ABC transporter substrate-binding protein [unclassified Rhizobium]|jgi:iron complex transport system substrate-binding protein|uniref:ABC transporter substrate-binding protein n=1 Tax=unclassified Rhizobium TaxID=2613769 RepID=UPI000645CFC2|nr:MULTISPECIES: ABC transporter substrate-binding protein [unclassified Rhizobium]MBN8952358.1 ABC transporter substrate-binding protein [Rhizobium tropici]OJY79708.1 MAG: iron ABC transporter substrate-binding protein [Rhizobium sp. 60-20]RKD66963.1 iron complex transport system substrate-binding protein [Rhizobium sp. WW_1]